MKNLLILSFVLSSVNHFFSQDASLIYKNTVNSTVTILTDEGSQGSGFFVAPNIIATNYHVVEGATNASCILNNSDIEYKIDGYVGIDKSVDLILLKVSTLNKPAIKFAVTTASIGQKVYVIGSPQGLPATISDGIISGMRDFEGIKLLQMTASISPGSSGGPVLNSIGELIGISVSQRTDGQNLNFAIPKSYLQILLDFKKNTPSALSTLISSKKPKIETLKIGDEYAGGIIFYLDNSNIHGAVCSKYDISNQRMTWFECIKSCNDLKLNGYSDWSLPTIQVLQIIYNNREFIGNFSNEQNNGYWSSSNADWEYAEKGEAASRLYFDRGYVDKSSKLGKSFCRAIRYF